MQPSKTNMKKSLIQKYPSRTCPSSPESEFDDERDIEETKNDGKRGLDWLISSFPSLSFDCIDSAYQEACGDAFKAAGILGAALVGPGGSPGSAGKRRSERKHRRLAACTGMVSGIIGKEYSKSALVCNAGRRDWGGPVEVKKRAVCAYSDEEAEEFLCSLLGGDSELGMGVVRDVLSQCGYDLEKALDALLDISNLSHNQSKETIGINHIEVVSGGNEICCVRNPEVHHEKSSENPSKNAPSLFQLTVKPSVSTHSTSAKGDDIGSGCRDYLKGSLETTQEVPSISGMVNSDLQKNVLDSLFNFSKVPCTVNSRSWKEVVKQVESFGQGLVLSFEGATEPSSASRVGGEDDYHVFRTVAQKNWDTMRSYYHKATLSYAKGEWSQASYFSEKGKFHKKLAHESDEKASQEIFEARNKCIKNIVTIDLHGQHVKQAIRLLKLHLLLFAYIPSVHHLRVITGRGADGGLGKLKHAVLNLVHKEGIKCNEENSGTLLLCLEGQRSFTFMDSEIDSDDANP